MDKSYTLAKLEQSDLGHYADAAYDPLNSPTKHELLAFVFRYKRRLITAFMLPLFLALCIAFLSVPHYVADAMLIVRLGPEYMYQTSNGVVGQPSQVVPFSNAQIFKSEAAILNSDGLHRDVVQAIGVAEMYPDLLHDGVFHRMEASFAGIANPVLVWIGLQAAPQLTPEQISQQHLSDAVKLFDDHLRVTLQPDSAVLTLQFEHQLAAISQKALDTLLQLYLEKRKEVYSEQHVATVTEELRGTRERLLSAERALDDFKTKHNVISFAAQRDALLALRNLANTEVQTLAAQAAEDRERIAALTRSAEIAGVDVTHYTERGDDKAFAALRQRFNEARVKLKLAQERYLPQSDLVQLAQRESQDINQILQSNTASQTPIVRTGRNSTYDAIDQDRIRAEAALTGAQARRAVVVSQVADLDHRLKDFDALATAHDNLEQQVVIARESVAQVSHKLDNARSQDDTSSEEADAVRIIQRPIVSPHPISIRFIVITGGGLVAFLVVLAVGACTEYFRSGFLTPEQLERELRLPVLGVMPYRRPLTP